MKTELKNLRAALQALGLPTEGDDVAELCGRVAAAGFCAMTDQRYAQQGVDVAYRAHHAFGHGWTEAIAAYWGDPLMAWSSLLNQLAITIPSGPEGPAMQLANVPAGALFLAGAACTLMVVDAESNDPSDKAAVAQAVAAIAGVASQLRPFAKSEHVMRSAGQS